MHGDGRALGRECTGDGGAGTAAPTGDEHDLAGESQVHDGSGPAEELVDDPPATLTRLGLLGLGHVLGIFATVRRRQLVERCLRRRVPLEGGLQLGRHLEGGRSRASSRTSSTSTSSPTSLPIAARVAFVIPSRTTFPTSGNEYGIT